MRIDSIEVVIKLFWLTFCSEFGQICLFDDLKSCYSCGVMLVKGMECLCCEAVLQICEFGEYIRIWFSWGELDLVLKGFRC